jgi:hypothetical protein
VRRRERALQMQSLAAAPCAGARSRSQRAAAGSGLRCRAAPRCAGAGPRHGALATRCSAADGGAAAASPAVHRRAALASALAATLLTERPAPAAASDAGDWTSPGLAKGGEDATCAAAASRRPRVTR